MSNDPISDLVMEFIARERKRQGLKQSEVAERAGIPISTYSCLEAKRFRVGPEGLLRCQLVLACPIHKLWPFGRWTVHSASDEVMRLVLAKAREQLPVKVEYYHVLEAVFEVTGFDAEELADPSRRGDLAEARALAAQLVSVEGLSIQGLGELLDRHGTTLSQGLRRLRNRAEREDHARNLIESARRWLRRVLREEPKPWE